MIIAIYFHPAGHLKTDKIHWQFLSRLDHYSTSFLLQRTFLGITSINNANNKRETYMIICEQADDPFIC